MKRDTPILIEFATTADDELEFHIREYGENMMAAYAAGDRMTAAQWLELQRQAIKSRSPEQINRMEACYLTEQGEADRAVVEASK